MSRDCCVALPQGAMGSVIVVFPDQTHYFTYIFTFYINMSHSNKENLHS